MGWGAEDQGRGAGALPPVAALLRRPSVWVRHQLMGELRRAGYADVLPAHLGVFQHPGPDGMRPGVLAARTRSSKQAMNHLLHQLEAAGYLRRESHPRDRRTRVVRLTERGRDVERLISEVCLRIEKAWAEALGDRVIAEMQNALLGLEKLLDEVDLG